MRAVYRRSEESGPGVDDADRIKVDQGYCELSDARKDLLSRVPAILNAAAWIRIVGEFCSLVVDLHASTLFEGLLEGESV